MRSYTKASPDGGISPRERENQRLAYEAACEGMVLLKNDGTLPLKTKKVALYGPGAAKTVKGGTGSGEVNERHTISVLEGLENRGFQVTTKKWIASYEAVYARALKRYRRQKVARFLKPGANMLYDNFHLPCGAPIQKQDDADTCIYVLSRQAGEGGDRRAEAGDYYLTEEEKAAIGSCAAHYEKLVLLLNCGSVLDMNFLEEIPGINAVLHICQPGSQGGNAVADILSGEICPSGRLTDTWAKRYEDIPFARDFGYLNGDLKNENYREGIFVGYRYFDSFGVEPAYPFGFGLSYTTFRMEGRASVHGSLVRVEVAVENTGDHAGKQVAQLYVSAPGQNREYQSLAAFGKTKTLAPGEQICLTLEFDLSALAFFREADSSFVLEQGDYILRLGDSSRNTVPVAAVALEEDVIVSRHLPIAPLQEPLQELRGPDRAQEALGAVPRLVADRAAFVTIDATCPVEEKPDDRVEKFLNGLTTDEMIDIVVGVGQVGAKKRFDLPGSVGNTTSQFWDRGLANAPLCDGPAGLRISRHNTITKKGRILPVEVTLSAYNYIPKGVRKLLMGKPHKQQSLYQYATAFPVTTALAQSWNTALLEQVGQGVAAEMEAFGCTYWLAPAVNIHRNPLCGRNFEYFSEDPRLTGLLAAAMTRGVQVKPGHYATVKHFVCNNQEDNRYQMSSNVSQRALREIYLRAFEPVVRQGKVQAVMTSYNRLNGVYTPNCPELCRVLRQEWGFGGVVMTDWYSTNRHRADNGLALAAGNDLIMPGGRYAKRQVRRGLRKGTVTQADIRRCCSHVVRAIFDSALQKEYIK